MKLNQINLFHYQTSTICLKGSLKSTKSPFQIHFPLFFSHDYISPPAYLVSGCTHFFYKIRYEYNDMLCCVGYLKVPINIEFPAYFTCKY